MNIKASDVAAIIGRNPYKTEDEVLNERVRFYYGIDVDTSETIFEKMLSEEPHDIQESVRNIISSKTVLDAHTEIKNVPESLKEYVKHEIYKNNGTIQENRTARKKQVISDGKMYTYPIYENVRLVGYIDGRRMMNNQIVEIKNRQRRLFKRVPDYEFIQCQVYMKLTDTLKCTLIEQFQEETMEHEIEYDDTLWTDEILPKLKMFAQRLIDSAPS